MHVCINIFQYIYRDLCIYIYEWVHLYRPPPVIWSISIWGLRVFRSRMRCRRTSGNSHLEYEQSHIDGLGNLKGQARPGPDGFGKHAKSIKSLFFKAFAFVCSWTMSRNILKTLTFLTFSMTHKPKHCRDRKRVE